MPKIKQLDQSEILKIAAGEVVQRPGNVVKELIENSVDSGAESVELHVTNFGLDGIAISDDGCGIEFEELELAIRPHATSKIQKLEDLYNLNTFGFRGEALASIAAVSQLEISSKSKSSDFGGQIKVDFGQKIFHKKSHHEAGTTISVSNLFENIPVRKKFLKSKETEFNFIANSFNNIALANPQISFSLFKDGRLSLSAQKVSNLRDRVAQIFDTNIAQNLIEFSKSEDSFEVSGLCSNLFLTRYNRNYIYLFVNGRSFKDSKIANAVCAAYSKSLPDGKFPMAFIFINIDPSLIDVNIHPTKEEIAFKDYTQLLKAVKDAVFESLNKQNQNTGASLFEEQNQPERNFAEANLDYSPIKNEEHSAQKQQEALNSITQNTVSNQSFSPNIEGFKPLNLDFCQSGKNFSQEFLFEEKIFANEVNVIGQIFETYIVVQEKDALVLFDQHAASERIIYENMKKNFEHLPKVKLLFPIILNFDITTLPSVLEKKELFVQFGIEFDQFSSNSIAVYTMPPNFEHKDLMPLFANQEAVSDSHDKEITRKNLFEHLHAEIACKTAIKAGKKMSIPEMKELLMTLSKVDNNFQCIHGRPTRFEMSQLQLEKIFKRK